MNSDDTTGGRITRRRLLAASGGAVGVAAGFAGSAGAQSATTTAASGATSPGDTTATEAQIQRRAIVPTVGEPFTDNYLGQFLVFTDPTPHQEVSPEIVGECAFADWAPAETRGYQGLLADRLSDAPRGVEVPVFLNGNQPPVGLGDVYIVGSVETCSEHYLGLELETVPVRRVKGPGGSLGGGGTAGEEARAGDDVGEATVADGGQPGFGILAGTLGLGGAGLLRWFRGRS